MGQVQDNHELVLMWADGPFHLAIYDTQTTDHLGKFRLSYRFYHVENGQPNLIFEGDDFCTPKCVDDPWNIIQLLGFLSLKDGDTDPEYFDDYTPEQIEWRDEHAEDLACVVADMEGSGSPDRPVSLPL